LFLGIETGLHLTPPIQLPVTSVICLSTGRKVCKIIWMGVRNKIVLDLIEFFLIIVVLVLVF
jgi:hypothetical protein